MKRTGKILSGAALGQGTALLCLFLCSIFLQKGSDPAAYALSVSLAAVILGGLVCGLFAALSERETPFVTAVCSAGLSALIQALLSFLPGGSGKPWWQILLIVALLFAIPVLVVLIRQKFFSSRRSRRARRSGSRAHNRFFLS